MLLALVSLTSVQLVNLTIDYQSFILVFAQRLVSQLHSSF